MWRSSDLPMVMFEAERLARIVAPASAPADEGGTAAQKSSQISMWKTKPPRSLASKIRSVPNGTSWPATRIVCPTRLRPWANQRFS